VDFSQIAISNFHQQLKGAQPPQVRYDPETGEAQVYTEGLQPNLLRHMILNSLRKIKREFGNRYGQIVLCADSHSYWRKDVFPNYKANRKKNRDASDIDWDLVFQTLNELREEIKINFPYKVMYVPRAEADDVIAVLANTFRHTEPILIVSSDKDFIQLLDQNVAIYRPIQKELLLLSPSDLTANLSAETFYTKKQVDRFLKEHIIRGDTGDGVPNFLSPDDVFVTEGTRQKPIMSAKVEQWIHQAPEEFCNEETLKNYNRNKQLVDLDAIPQDVQDVIMAEFEKPIVGKASRIYSYFVRHRMKSLLEVMGEF